MTDAGVMEIVEVQQLDDDALKCNARKEGCDQRATWRHTCPKCGIVVLYCEEHRWAWEAFLRENDREYHFGENVLTQVVACACDYVNHPDAIEGWEKL